MRILSLRKVCGNSTLRWLNGKPFFSLNHTNIIQKFCVSDGTYTNTSDLNQKAPCKIDINQHIDMLRTTHKYVASVAIFSSEMSISMKLPSIYQNAKDIFKHSS